MKTQFRIFTAALLIVSIAGPAYPQRDRDIQLLMKDMIDLQQLVKQLQSSVDRNNDVVRGLLERTADQVNMLAGGMQTIAQTIDGVKTQNDATTRELRTILASMNGAVKELEESVSSARTQINSISRELTTLKTTAEPLEGPDDLWRNANVDYSVGNWDLAIGGLQEFLSKYPEEPRAADAQVRIGDSLAAQKKFDLAILQYDIVLQKYPDSDKSKTALLKKGLAQAEINPQQAINTLNEVVKKSPGTSEAAMASSKVKELQSAQRRTPGR